MHHRPTWAKPPAQGNPGSNPRHDRVRCLTSLACRLRSERPGFDSGFGSTAFRGIGRCRLRATETQQATPLNYADGRDRRQREAAATAPRAWSRKMPWRTSMHALKCGDKGCLVGGKYLTHGVSSHQNRFKKMNRNMPRRFTSDSKRTFYFTSSSKRFDL